MKRGLKLSGVVLSLLLLSGCTGTEPEVVIPTAGSQIDQDNRTSYTTVLERTNSMIQVFKGEPMNVFIDTIENKTAARGKLPADITDIVKTSFNKIGDYVTVIYNDNSENLKRTEVYTINGAITEYDIIEAKDSGMDAAATGTVNKNRYDADGSIDNENQIVKLAINFNPSDMHKGNYVSRTSTSNKVTIQKKSSANAFAFSILGSGFGFNNAVTKSQGVHASITVLVELSVAEVLGKLGKFPYWLLLDGGKVNRDVVNHLSGEFLREPLNKKIEKISYLLALKGKNVQVTRLMNNQLKQAIIEYKSAHVMRADDIISKKLYLSLLGV
ncbi:MAG: hypothetical protein K0U38_00195 [Epsilonproteobacteria bacterium]|nr:hypothetical protein [Campylobacterota bacterium]